MESSSPNIAWNENTTYALGLYKLITQSLGIWPLKCHDILSRIRLVSVTISQAVMIISLLSEINLDCGAVNDVIQMSSLAACGVLVLSKMFVIYRYREGIFEIISSAIEDWQSATNSTIFKIIRKNAKLSRRICIFQMTSAYLTVILIALGSLPFLVPPTNETMTENITVTSYQSLPLRTTCVFGEMTTLSYIAIYMFQVIQLLVTCTANVGCDCFFFGITLHVAGQFEHLVYEYENFYSDASKVDCGKNLSILIAKHKKYLNFADNIEGTFNFVLLFQLSVNMIQISLNGMQLIMSLQLGDTATVVNVIVIYYVLNLQIFLYSYAGDRLTSGIGSLHNAVYFSSWYDLSPKISKNLTFIMLKAGKTFNLTAGKIFCMNIDSFKNILKATFSYFSFLRAMLD